MHATTTKESFVLIGMPCSGKTTIGALLAEALSLKFVDTDRRIEQHIGDTLQNVLDTQGYMALRQLEEKILLKEEITSKVVATGGSAVYSQDGMNHLKSSATVIFLDLPQHLLEQRMTNFSTRGIARKPGQSFSSLFAERRELYLRYADIHVDCEGLNISQLLAKLVSLTKPEAHS
jgi:shikimate kinase